MGPLTLAGSLGRTVLLRQDGGIQPAQVGGQSQYGQRVNCPLGRINIVPAWAVAVIARIGMVIVVVALAEGETGDEPTVAAAVALAMRLRAEHVTEGIDRERGVQDHEHSEHACEQKTPDAADHAAVEIPQDEGKREPRDGGGAAT